VKTVVGSSGVAVGSPAGAARPRVLIALGSDIAFRNFVESGGCRELTARFDAWAIRLPGLRSALTPSLGIRDAGVAQDRAWRDSVRYHLSWVSIYAGRRRARMMRAKARMVGGKAARLYAILGSRALYPLTDGLAEAVVGRDRDVEAIVETTRPDAVVVPYGGLNSFTLDLCKTARRRGIATVLVNYNWDNVASKGILRHTPDAFCVWGDDMADLTERVYRFPKRVIHVIGAAHFEHYFDPVRMREAAREADLLRGGVPRVLFAGSSRGHPEVPYLEKIEQAIDDGRLPPMKVVYRPHPWRTSRPEEKNFFDIGFRHVEIDPKLAERFTRETINRTWTDKSKTTFKPDLEYYPVLLRSVDAVISPLSTLALEAALVGRPLLVMTAFAEPWMEGAAERFEYLQRLVHHVPGVVKCDAPDTFVDALTAVMRLAADPGIAERIQEATRPIVFRDATRTYGRRLAAVVDSVLATRARG
jgi:hypothetical protein